jgi:F0F1-type ATP synthase assembly protein I
VNRRVPSQEEIKEEAEHFTAGPGVAATKSQARGSLIGFVAGTIVGALIGALIGLLIFEGTLGLVITTVAFGVAGATFGGVSGGFVAPRRKLGSTQADK